ncbi:helix-turn-helix domain-containing protein [Enterococcus mundtii]|uniref:helix-turn-helix domain-containing protein n=1 Tax=Enterococcus mundtii TaxID=53346 RepID=UPI00325B0543
MDIKHVYGKNIKKKITLVNILYNNHDWITTSELAEQTKLERKTTLKYIAELERDFELFNHPELTMEFSKGRGTFLQAGEACCWIAIFIHPNIGPTDRSCSDLY